MPIVMLILSLSVPALNLLKLAAQLGVAVSAKTPSPVDDKIWQGILEVIQMLQGNPQAGAEVKTILDGINSVKK